jgi:ribosomal protein L22
MEKNTEKQDKVAEETKKIEKKTKKTEAIVNGRSLPISVKQGVAICNLIRGKNPEKAINILEEVIKMKKAVPMTGEIPHRKGKGMMSGRYPIKATENFILLLKSVKANAIANEMEIENCIIKECKTNTAPRPYKRFGKGKIKRAHVTIKLVEANK